MAPIPAAHVDIPPVPNLASLESLFVPALQLVLSIDSLLWVLLSFHKAAIVKGQDEERGLGLLICKRMP